ncbi:sulfatase family protein [Bacteroides caccae]|jgi:N-sulfoglucosamine sulfohydrolase|uniref:sulfatase family protein n=1 Tax=Bacteroides caccae TaxID=47678 RepID=UPI0032EC6950
MNTYFFPFIPLLLSNTVMMTTAAQKKQPNILFCIADDAGHMSAYGTSWVNTPAFDKVAREGLLFEQAFTCNAKSAPSRAAIITGRNSWQLKEACNHWPVFPYEFKSYPEALSDNGYYVGYTGKGWGPGFANDIRGNKRDITGKPWNRKKLVPPTTQISNVDYSANFKDFLKNWDRKQPFCFWYGSLEPHRGYEFESSRRFGKDTSQIDSVPSYWPDNEVVRRDMLDYAVEIEHFDYHLGIILRALEETGELDNTVVIVTSDHGMPFPRCKGQEYYHSNHIPMAMMWKKGIQHPGRKVSEYISVIDLAPTILEITNISQEQSGMQAITGRSFMDILKNENTGIDRNFIMIGKERHDVGRPNDEGYPIRGLIRGDFLYLRNYETNRWPAGNPETGFMNVDGSPTKTEVLKARRNPKTAYLWELSFGKRDAEELYNIKKDPNCINNLTDNKEYRKIKLQMEKEMTMRLLQQGDPRMYGKGSVFDRYPDASKAHQFWNRTKVGEKVPFGWINESDFEPKASDLNVSGNI